MSSKNHEVADWQMELEYIGASGPIEELEAHLARAPVGLPARDRRYLVDLIEDRKVRAARAPLFAAQRLAQIGTLRSPTVPQMTVEDWQIELDRLSATIPISAFVAHLRAAPAEAPAEEIRYLKVLCQQRLARTARRQVTKLVEKHGDAR